MIIRRISTHAAALALAFGSAGVAADPQQTGAQRIAEQLPIPVRAEAQAALPRERAGMEPDFSTLDSNRDAFIERDDLAVGSSLRENFDRHDADNDGRISRSEFDAWHQSVAAGSRAPFTAIDTDADGAVSRDEVGGNARLHSQFDRHDVDRDNRLSRNEYQTWSTSAGAGQVRDFTSVDTDNDGFVLATDLQAGSPIARQFDQFDLDNDNRLSRTEYDVAAIENQAATRIADTGVATGVAGTRSFEQLDTDGDGQLSTAEMQADRALAGRVSMYDRDGDGMVSASEYRHSLATADFESDFDADFDDGTDTEER